VGDRLIENRSVGGAKLEDVIRRIDQVEDIEGSQLMVIAGTNNFQTEGARVVLEKYESLVNKMKMRQGGCIVVGISKRFDLDKYAESRRIVVNMKLKEMCERSGIGYVEFEPTKKQGVRDGLHLNASGLHRFGRMLFKKLVPFL